MHILWMLLLSYLIVALLIEKRVITNTNYLFWILAVDILFVIQINKSMSYYNRKLRISEK